MKKAGPCEESGFLCFATPLLQNVTISPGTIVSKRRKMARYLTVVGDGTQKKYVFSSLTRNFTLSLHRKKIL